MTNAILRKIAVLNLSEALPPKLSSYLESRGIQVVNGIIGDSSLEWTHIITSDMQDFSGLELNHGTVEKDIKIISLTPVDHPQSFANANGRLIFEPLWLRGQLGEFILDKFFQEFGITDNDAGPTFKEIGNFNISNAFSTGEFMDRMVYHAFEEGARGLAVKSYFDHILMFLAGLKANSKLGWPLEASYGVFEGVFAVQLKFFSKNLLFKEVTSCFGDVNSRKTEDYLLNLSVQSADFFDFTYLTDVKKVVITALWTQEKWMRFENRGIMLTQLSSKAAKSSYAMEASAKVEDEIDIEDQSDLVDLPKVAGDPDTPRVVKGKKSLKERYTIVTGSADEEDEEAIVVKGGPKDKQSSRKVSGGDDEEDDESTVVSGTLDLDEDVQIVKGKKEKKDLFKQSIGGGDDDEDEPIIVKGHKEAKKAGPNIKQSESEEEEVDDVIIVKGSSAQKKGSMKLGETHEEEEEQGSNIAIVKGANGFAKKPGFNVKQSEVIAVEEAIILLKGAPIEKKKGLQIKQSDAVVVEQPSLTILKGSPVQKKAGLQIKQSATSAEGDEEESGMLIIGGGEGPKPKGMKFNTKAPQAGQDAEDDEVVIVRDGAPVEKKKTLFSQDGGDKEQQQDEKFVVKGDGGLSALEKAKLEKIEVKALSKLPTEEREAFQKYIDQMKIKAQESDQKRVEAETQLKIMTNENEVMKKEIKKLITEVRIHQETKSIMAEMNKKAAAEDVTDDLKRLQIETVRKETFYFQEIEKSQRQLKSKDAMLEKAKEMTATAMSRKNKAIEELQQKIDHINTTMAGQLPQQLQTQIKMLEREKENQFKIMEMYKQKISTMSAKMTNKDVKETGDGSKDEVRKLALMNTQLRNQFESTAKELKRYQEKAAQDMTVINQMKTDKMKTEQLLKQTAALEVKRPGEQSNTISKIQHEVEIRRLTQEVSRMENIIKEAQKKGLQMENLRSNMAAAQVAAGVAPDAVKDTISQEDPDRNRESADTMKEELRKLAMTNTHLKGQFESTAKELKRYQEKLAQDTVVINQLKMERAKTEQLLKQASLEMKKSGEQTNTVSKIQHDIEIKKLSLELGRMENIVRDAQRRIKEAEAKALDTSKGLKGPGSQGAMVEEASKGKQLQLETSLKKLTQDLSENRLQLAEMKKESNKLRQDKTALQNQVDRLKKDLEKANGKVPKPGNNGGKAA